MSQPKAFEFITVTTGAVVMSSRADVEEAVIQKIKECLATDGKFWGGWSMKFERSYPGGHRFLLLNDDIEITRCWICNSKLISEMMWAQAQTESHDTVVLHRPKGLPWLAVAILPTIIPVMLKTPEKLLEAADAERCIAWALLDMNQE